MNERLSNLLRHPETPGTPMIAALSAVASSAVTADAAGAAAPSKKDVSESELERLRQRLRELASELVIASEAARVHLARELHDGVGPELTAARFALASMAPALPNAEACDDAFALAQRSLDAACEAARRIVTDLHGPQQFDGGIVGALSQWTQAFTERTGLRTSFVCAADFRLTQLPHDAALAVFRVAQEALGNVAKHAGASCADVRIETDVRHLTLTIADDGRGMPRRPRKADLMQTTGFGLTGMRARCEALGGSLRILGRRACKAEAAHVGRGAIKAGTTVWARFDWAAMLGEPSAPPTAACNAPCNAARDATAAR
jgi:two-component system sensor histidine kinase UhpB